MTNINAITIYTDGACSGNPGPGGWGVVMMWKDKVREIQGYEENTTNNRMELMAVIKALESVKLSKSIHIYTDSQYVKKGITVWINTWKKNHWNNGKVKNVDLWQVLWRLTSKHKLEWFWVRGHSGNVYNERADKLAREMIEYNNAGNIE